MCVDYVAASDVLQARSDSGISGTLVQRIKSQMCLQPYHAYTNRKQGGEQNKFCLMLAQNAGKVYIDIETIS
jgi:hypothetical protein